jgi:hypothetical protein
MICGAVILRPLGIVPKGSSPATEAGQNVYPGSRTMGTAIVCHRGGCCHVYHIIVAIDCETRIGEDLSKIIQKRSTPEERVKFIVFSYWPLLL